MSSGYRVAVGAVLLLAGLALLASPGWLADWLAWLAAGSGL
jgi:hypothetical protein